MSARGAVTRERNNLKVYTNQVYKRIKSRGAQTSIQEKTMRRHLHEASGRDEGY
jgi:hypothetical protein